MTGQTYFVTPQSRHTRKLKEWFMIFLHSSSFGNAIFVKAMNFNLQCDSLAMSPFNQTINLNMVATPQSRLLYIYMCDCELD